MSASTSKASHPKTVLQRHNLSSAELLTVAHRHGFGNNVHVDGLSTRMGLTSLVDDAHDGEYGIGMGASTKYSAWDS